MLTPDNLAFIRTQELQDLMPHFARGTTLLEIGAGTGLQAKELTRVGLQVSAVDLPGSAYSDQRVFPVVDYDGRHLPFPDRSFDVVFTSNVLEHVPNLRELLVEIRRVLRPTGYCIHAMPTPAWRLWSTVSGYLDLPVYLIAVCTGKVKTTPLHLIKGVLGRLIPFSHGKVHSALVEVWAWRQKRWICTFEQSGFEVVRAEPMRLFYTGWSLLGRHLSVQARKSAAGLLGSASWMFEVRPRHQE